MKSEATSGISVKKKNSEIDLGRKLLITFLAVVVSSGVWLASASLGQEGPAPGGGEPAKVEAPSAAPGAPSSAPVSINVGSEEGRSRSGTGAVYPRAIGTDRRGEGGDGHDVDFDCRDAGVLHEPWLCDGGIGSMPCQERGYDSG